MGIPNFQWRRVTKGLLTRNFGKNIHYTIMIIARGQRPRTTPLEEKSIPWKPHEWRQFQVHSFYNYKRMLLWLYEIPNSMLIELYNKSINIKALKKLVGCFYTWTWECKYLGERSVITYKTYFASLFCWQIHKNCSTSVHKLFAQ